MFKGRNLIDLVSEILGYTRRYSQGISEVEFNCPNCDGGRNKFNLVVNIENHVFHCWSCQYRGRVARIFSDLGDQDQKVKYDRISLKPTYTNIEEEDTEDISIGDFRSLKVEWADSLTYKAAMKYLSKRKITKEHIDQWDICYSENGKYSDRIIVPSRNLRGKVEYFIARDIWDTNEMKYKNPRSRKQTVIFGEKFIDWTKPVILTEGVFDAMVLYNAVPLLGTKIEGHDKLIRKIMKHKTPIILGFDEDKTGETERIKVAKYLENLGSTLYIITGNEYNDLASAFQERGRGYLVDLVRKAELFDELEMKLRLL